MHVSYLECRSVILVQVTSLKEKICVESIRSLSAANPEGHFILHITTIADCAPIETYEEMLPMTFMCVTCDV